MFSLRNSLHHLLPLLSQTLIMILVVLLAVVSSTSNFVFAQTTTSVPPIIQRVGSVKTHGTNDAYYSGFKYADNGYFAAYRNPSFVSKFNLNTMQFISNVSTASTTSFLISSNLWIDTSSSNKPWGIFSSVASVHSPQILKLDINSMTFASEQFTGTAGQSIFTGVIVGTHGYYCSYTVPGNLFQIALSTMTSTGVSVSGSSNENYFESSALLPGSEYIMVGSSYSGTAASLVKFQIVSGGTSLSRIGAVSGASTDESPFVSITILGNDIAFAVCFGSPIVVKFDTTSMTRLGSAVGSSTTSSAQYHGSVVLPNSNEVAFVSFEANPGKILKLNSDSMSILTSTEGLSSNDERLFRSVITDGVTYAWVGTGTGSIVKFDIRNIPTTTPSPPATTLAGGTTSTVAVITTESPPGAAGPVAGNDLGNGGFNPRGSGSSSNSFDTFKSNQRNIVVIIMSIMLVVSMFTMNF